MEKNFDQILKNNLSTYDNIRIGCLLDYPYFEKGYKLIAIDLSKQQKLDADSKPKQQFNFTGNPSSPRGAKIFFIIEEVKKTVLDFSKGIVKVL